MTDPTPAPKPPEDIAQAVRGFEAVFLEMAALRTRCETAEEDRDALAKALRQRDEARAEVERLRAYVGGQMLRSDFRTADEMRAALDAALAEADRLRQELAFECLKRST